MVTLAQGKNGKSGLVISPDRKPIPPKANDPDAPTDPGLHVIGRHFKFAWSQLTLQEFSFRTVNVNGSEFSFQGQFGREQVDVIPEVPYLEGVLSEKRESSIVREKNVHFGQGFVLYWTGCSSQMPLVSTLPKERRRFVYEPLT
jgi:hypothetical protein